MAIKHLYIIGNGFDKHHDMKTGYDDFCIWLKENDFDTFCTINRLFGYCNVDEDEDDYSFYCNHECYDYDTFYDNLWKNFEENLAKAVTSKIVQQKIRGNYPDFSSDNFRESSWFAAESAVEDNLNNAYDEIRRAFYEWVAGLAEGNNDKKIKLVDDYTALFLTFNYTDTLETLYGIGKEKILYIHGKAETNDELIFGHGSSKEEIIKILEKDYPQNLDRDDFCVQRANFAAIDSVYEQRKKVSKIIASHEEWFASLRDVTNLYIYGHSLAKVDLPYFTKILSVVNKEIIRIEASYYKDNERSIIEAFMQSEGIGENQYSLVNLDNKILKTEQKSDSCK